MKLKNIFLITLLSFFACSESKETNFNICNECVVISNELYKSTNTDNYSILDIAINEDLLTIKIGASGCSSNSWVATLIDADEVLESFPIQRNIKLLLENNEACLAFFEKEFTFNIKELKENQPEVILNLAGWSQQINYK